jgi:hypothetical protein
MKTLTVRANESVADRGMDPFDCDACLAARDICGFHAGWAAGWDDAVSALAGWREEADLVELVAEYEDDARVVA